MIYYIAYYIGRELILNAIPSFVYYSLSTATRGIKYIVTPNNSVEPIEIIFCPSFDICELLEESDYEVIITKESAIYDISRILDIEEEIKKKINK
jgi:hypothetical protein